MTIKFNNTPNEFAAVLKRSVYEHLDANKLKHTGNWKLYIKTCILFAIAISIYVLVLSINIPVWFLLPLAVLFGLTLASIGFNVMHDGAHGVYSSKKWVNRSMAYSLNLMGGSSYFWAQKHNIQHHSFTNIEEHDDDIDIRPWIRTNKHQSRKWYHRYQHIYWVFLYGFTYLIWVSTQDFKKYFSRKIANRKIKVMSTREHFIFWITKVLYVFSFIVLPILTMGLLKAILFYTIAAFSCGWIISIVFQLAHIVEDTSFPVPCDHTNKMEANWVIHQLSTTANFSTGSKIISWFSGGLNYQIEHHLFPKISHVHYPKISELVKEICLQHNVNYVEYPSLFSALRSHVKHLKAIGVTA